jgi:opacity protein-like surface antigen
MLSTEFRAFAGENFQNRNYRLRQYSTTYDGVGTGSEVTFVDNTTGSFTLAQNNNEFVWGFDVRADAAYQVTRSVSLRAGWSFTDFARGIWRGANPGFGDTNLNDQSVILSGVTFGVTLNR